VSLENKNKVADEIAFQANVLALNAAIEGARAGENGGILVTASEVRVLAQKGVLAADDPAALEHIVERLLRIVES
jgi:methyl-accepting chemotaxis protein